MKKLLLCCFLLGIACSNRVQAQTVYVTKSGEKYHTASCSYLKYSKIAKTLEQVQNLGYSPCSVCQPDTHVASDFRR